MTVAPQPNGPEDGVLPPPAGPPVSTDTADDSAKGFRSAVEWFLFVGGAIVLALLVRAFLVQAFYIPSESMLPTLHVEDRVLVNKLSYRLHDVERGDIVVFERPPSDTPSEIDDLIKRVVALPGETVEGRDGRVYVDGQPLDESYLPAGSVTTNFGPELVPEGHLWVMGDNRTNSQDSRYLGPIDEDLVIGRAFVRIWPFSRLGLL